LLVALLLLSACVFLTFTLLRQTLYSDLRSFSISLLAELESDPRVLQVMPHRQDDGWQDVDEGSLSNSITVLLEQKKLDSGRLLERQLRRRMEQEDLRSIVRVQVRNEQGEWEIRIINPGFDRRFDTRDDQIVE
jgi:hypothetical protein